MIVEYYYKKMIKQVFILVIILMGFCSCTKEEITTVKLRGVITNDATGLPLKNVAVWIVMKDYDLESTYSDSSITNSKGEYTIDVMGEGIDNLQVSFYKPGFVYYSFKPEKNIDLIKNIILYPIDSYIKFKFINKLNFNETIYGSYWSFIYPHSYLSKYEYVPAKLGETYYETMPCPGNMNIYVTWDYFFYNSELNFPNMDSIYVPRGDTAIYTIQF